MRSYVEHREGRWFAVEEVEGMTYDTTSHARKYRPLPIFGGASRALAERVARAMSLIDEKGDGDREQGHRDCGEDRRRGGQKA